MDQQTRILVAGGDTLLGAALLRRLHGQGYHQLLGLPPREPDWTDAEQVDNFFLRERPEYVFLTGGPSGGIEENRRYPADLMVENLQVAVNVIPAAFRHGIRKLLYVGSSCCYPKSAPQPLRVEYLLTGPLEPTNLAYASAKLAGLTLCRAYRQQYDAPFITTITANLFGPDDDFHPESGHVISGLMRRMHRAKVRAEPHVVIWGSGRPTRDFLYVDDAADACIFLMRHYNSEEPINVGSGTERSILETARTIAEVVGYRGRLLCDPNRPDGMPRRLLDSSPLFDLGWRPRTDFRTALAATYEWFLHQQMTEEPYVALAV
ncbi:MAG: GDP-L-fucose synthase [Gemmataceae bacterium]|nr:GDP-L-fucose synthase [Gemmataceae bacterium]